MVSSIASCFVGGKTLSKYQSNLKFDEFDKILLQNFSLTLIDLCSSIFIIENLVEFDAILQEVKAIVEYETPFNYAIRI